MLTQYFDQNDFEGDPIKNLINFDLFYTLNRNLSSNFVYRISQNFVELYDSLFTNLFNPIVRSY